MRPHATFICPQYQLDFSPEHARVVNANGTRNVSRLGLDLRKLRTDVLLW